MLLTCFLQAFLRALVSSSSYSPWVTRAELSSGAGSPTISSSYSVYSLNTVWCVVCVRERERKRERERDKEERGVRMKVC